MLLGTAHGRVWWTALGAERLQRLAADDEQYDVLAARAPHERSVELRLVEKDVGRTFSDRPELSDGDARERLRRVLSAYALRHTYCQGMSYVAALLLQHLPEAEAFWALAALVEEFLPAGYFTDDLHGAYMDQHIAFAQFLPYRLPRLAAHLEELDVPLTLIGMRWFLCLFAADMEPQLTANLWDFLFSHGAHMLFAVALGLLAAVEDDLLAKPDMPELFVAVRAIGNTPLPWRTLYEFSHGFPTEADVQVARAAYQRERLALTAISELSRDTEDDGEGEEGDDGRDAPFSSDGAAASASFLAPLPDVPPRADESVPLPRALPVASSTRRAREPKPRAPKASAARRAKGQRALAGRRHEAVDVLLPADVAYRRAIESASALAAEVAEARASADDDMQVRALLTRLTGHADMDEFRAELLPPVELSSDGRSETSDATTGEMHRESEGALEELKRLWGEAARAASLRFPAWLRNRFEKTLGVEDDSSS